MYTPYNFEFGVGLREQITLCDVGDISTIPANNEKSFDQISKGVAHIFGQGTFLQGSQLIIRETPLIAYCHPCGQEYKPEIGQRYACPRCGSPMEEIRSGRELKIDQIECLTDSAPAARPEVA